MQRTHEMNACTNLHFIWHRQLSTGMMACILGLAFLVLTGCQPADNNATSGGGLSVRTDSSESSASGRATESETLDPLQAARAFLKQGDLDAASASVTEQMIRQPDDEATILLASQIEKAKGNLETAIGLAESIPGTSPTGAEATNLLVQFFLENNQPAKAVQRLGEALQHAASATTQTVLWRQQLWAILNRLGRRQEASAQADVLCRAGYINRQLLISLLRRNESFPLTLGEESPVEYFYSGMGLARWFFSQGDFRKAMEHLQNGQASGVDSPAAKALWGRLLAETQATKEIPEWYAACNDETRKFSDYWVALGIFFFDRHQLPASARALMEAVYIDPTDDDACHRLARVLTALGRGEDASIVREHGIRVATLKNLVKKLPLRQPRIELTADLPAKLVSLGRPFESIGWALLDLPPENVPQRNRLQQQREFLTTQPETKYMASEMAIAEMDRAVFSMQDAIDALLVSSRQNLDAGASVAADNDHRSKPLPLTPVLENVSGELGLDFQWYHAKEIDLSSIPLHEMIGGGIGVCDYDLDGYPDVYFAQGSSEPPLERSTRSNQMFRNIDGRFVDTTRDAGAEDRRYSSGIAAGDVNQDGFPDLYLGAIGGNRLLINNGDGTFRDATERMHEPSPQFTTSVAIADLTGDGIPELYECVYVEMKDAFRLPERDSKGLELAPSPNDFFAEVDRWYLNQRDGNFQPRVPDRDRIEPGTSLGLVVTDVDADGSNDVLVSNDARPNHLLVGFDQEPVDNIAGPVGVAFGFRGFSNSCMGIAPGDFNRDGRIDFHITNFVDEPNNFFLQGDSGLFSDYATQYRLTAPTQRYVGFGIKSVDFNRDGWLDFFTTNGHVFDERIRDGEFQMPPQVLANQASSCVVAKPIDKSGYCDDRFVGRSVAGIDFDRDLDIDLLVGHLDVPAALLANKTVSQGSALQLVLVGTDCERDAIGTRVVVTTGSGERFAQWVTAGDGFLCSDDPVIDFGLGDATKIELVEVNWISGQRQEFRDLQPNGRYLIVQGQSESWHDHHD